MTTKRTNQQSWEMVATLLAGRLIYHDFCPEVDYDDWGTKPRHPHYDVGLLVGCPYCEGRFAMACYYAKRAGRVPPQRPVDNSL